MKYLLIICFACHLTSSWAQSEPLEFPEIDRYGGVLRLEEAVPPEKGGKILIDLSTPDSQTGVLNSGLDRVARLINLFALADIPAGDLEVKVIIHGGATKTVLSDEAFEEKYGQKNPNTDLIKSLKDKGVDLMVCGQAFLRNGFQKDNLNPDIKMALSAITTLVDAQQKGYSVLYY